MDIDRTARISFGAKLDKTHPKGIHIGAESYLSLGVVMLAHNFLEREQENKGHVHTYIGKRCFIGINVIIMPGVKIGDQVFIAAGSVISKDIESNTLVAGNPARILRTGLETGKYGIPI